MSRLSLKVHKMLTALRTQRRRALLLAGLTIAAVPVTGAVAMQMDHGNNTDAASVHTPNKQPRTDSVAPKIDLNTSESGAANSDSSNATSVSINGQDIPADENGNVNTIVDSHGTTTSVSVDNSAPDISQTGTVTNSSGSTTNVTVRSSSSSTAVDGTESNRSSIKIRSSSR